MGQTRILVKRMPKWFYIVFLSLCVLMWYVYKTRIHMIGNGFLERTSETVQMEMDPNIANKIESEFIFRYTEDGAKEEAALCDEKFNETFESNLQVIANYPRGVADKYLPLLGDNQSEPSEITEYPVIVMGFDENYYGKAEGLFQSLHVLMDNPIYSGRIKCLVYDLGMNEKQIEILKQKSRCEVRHFRFEDYPEHVRILKNYAFKPIIVQTALMEHGFVWWVDASIRINATHFDVAVNYLKRYGWMFTICIADRHRLSITRQTHAGMFQFLGEDPCKFRPFGEILGGHTLFFFNRVSRTVVRAWASCALNLNCISPVGAKLHCDMHKTFDGRCHRYDQSMLGIMARRLYHEQHRYPMDERLFDIFSVRRRERVTYLDNLPN